MPRQNRQYSRCLDLLHATWPTFNVSPPVSFSRRVGIRVLNCHIRINASFRNYEFDFSILKLWIEKSLYHSLISGWLVNVYTRERRRPLSFCYPSTTASWSTAYLHLFDLVVVKMCTECDVSVKYILRSAYASRLSNRHSIDITHNSTLHVAVITTFHTRDLGTALMTQ